jgi:Gram-negative bacterial TonB protein C-terminal
MATPRKTSLAGLVALLVFALTATLAQEFKELPCTSPPVNGRICVSEEILNRFLVTRVAPQNPNAAKPESEVVLHVIVGKDGRAEKVSLISGDSSVAHSAISAVKKWLFTVAPFQRLSSVCVPVRLVLDVGEAIESRQ